MIYKCFIEPTAHLVTSFSCFCQPLFLLQFQRGERGKSAEEGVKERVQKKEEEGKEARIRGGGEKERLCKMPRESKKEQPFAFCIAKIRCTKKTIKAKKRANIKNKRAGGREMPMSSPRSIPPPRLRERNKTGEEETGKRREREGRNQ
jgi:hypothetical protein